MRRVFGFEAFAGVFCTKNENGVGKYLVTLNQLTTIKYMFFCIRPC